MHEMEPDHRKIVTENNIEVNPEDIREAARKQLFSYLGGLPQGDEQPWVEDYVNKMMQDRRFVEETYQNQRPIKCCNGSKHR